MSWGEKRMWIKATMSELKLVGVKPLKEAIDPHVGMWCCIGDWSEDIVDTGVAGETNIPIDKAIGGSSPLRRLGLTV